MTYSIAQLVLPELILVIAAGVLFLLGTMRSPGVRRAVPVLACVALAAAVLAQTYFVPSAAPDGRTAAAEASGAIRLTSFTAYVRILAGLVGLLLMLLAWPTNADAEGNDSLELRGHGGEFFGLALLSIAGLMLTAAANDIIVLFLALELVSLPTYVMVSVSRPLAVTQEAGVKYFFLGAMAAALLLLGFSYLYGVTGSIRLDEIGRTIQEMLAGAQRRMPAWLSLGVIVLLVGLAFKIAAVPLHFYAGDVYEGAATPVTAFLAFVPKAAGFVAIVKLLAAIGGSLWQFPPELISLLWVLALLTMSAGNVLALLQQNVKRVLAYSSVAHSGYMLVGLAALTGATTAEARRDGLIGLLFYLAAYGVTNVGAFGMLMLLSARPRVQDGRIQPFTTAETYEDLAGAARRHPGLGLAMAISCFSLIGIPLTAGFLGKFMLIMPALKSGSSSLTWLALLTVINAAISAGYYLHIIGAMFLRSEPGESDESQPAPARFAARPLPIMAAIVLSTTATLVMGFPPGATALSYGSHIGSSVDAPVTRLAPPATRPALRPR